MKFNVTEIEFDFDEYNDENSEWQLSQEERDAITLKNLGVWEADDEDDLVEEVTCASGWCIRKIDYEVQLK
tara:strand:- start:42 stop:254 length:213 start_codon:yes stop_codon:yes gene_type:complete